MARPVVAFLSDFGTRDFMIVKNNQTIFICCLYRWFADVMDEGCKSYKRIG